MVWIDDVNELQKELKNNYVINQELSSLARDLALRCGRWLVLANAALITTKHIKFEKETEYDVPPPPSNTPTRDSEGYPLEGFDEVGK